MGQPPAAPRPSAKRSEGYPHRHLETEFHSQKKTASPPPAVVTPVSPFPPGDGGREDLRFRTSISPYIPASSVLTCQARVYNL